MPLGLLAGDLRPKVAALREVEVWTADGAGAKADAVARRDAKRVNFMVFICLGVWGLRRGRVSGGGVEAESKFSR